MENEKSINLIGNFSEDYYVLQIKRYLLFRVMLRQMKIWLKPLKKTSDRHASIKIDPSSSDSLGSQAVGNSKLSLVKNGVGNFGTYMCTPLSLLTQELGERARKRVARAFLFETVGQQLRDILGL